MSRYFSTVNLLTGLLVFSLLSPLSPKASETKHPLSLYACRIVNSYPHDQSFFTQGLIFKDGFVYEGTGIRGKSRLIKMRLENGETVKSHRLPDQFFGEGITIYKDKLIQLTWRSRTGFIYDVHSFRVLRTFGYKTEGWGITHDEKKLIVSDGTATLYFWDPETLKERGRIRVYDKSGPVAGLNELEYVRGAVYANVWRTNRIAIISLSTGRVQGWIDLKMLSDLAGGDNTVKVLNGIAYDDERDRLFVTGKLWPKIYEIDLVPLDSP